MIKILPSGTTARFSFGIKPTRTRSIRGRLGEGAREHDFITPLASLKAKWKDHGIDTILESASDTYVRDISLTFHYHSPKTTKETAIWTDSADTALPGGNLTLRKKRSGCAALWLAEDYTAEGIIFRQSPPAEYPISFECHPGAKTLSVIWSIQRVLKEGEKLALPTVRMSRGVHNRLVPAWQREWRNSSKRVPAPDRRVGWKDDGEAESPRVLKEIVTGIRNAKIPVKWYALGPAFTSRTGDWLEPAESFRDKMGNASRSITEKNFIPALRFAPFLVSKKASLAGRRDWMLQYPNGNPIQVKPYGHDSDATWILDISNEEVREHIKKTLSVMRDQWGFRAFVLERLGDLALPGRRSEESHGPGYWYESAADLIREALGSKVYIVASGIPLQIAAGQWDARTVTSNPRSGSGQIADCSRLRTAAALLFRSPWAEGGWSNASCSLGMELFRSSRSTATSTMLNAAAISTGTAIFVGDPRNETPETINAIKTYLELFEESRTGRVLLSDIPGGGKRKPLIVRNDTGRIGLFNLSRRKREVRLDREGLKTALGVASTLSAGDGAVFNSPEIHVALPPRGNRLFKG